ncbi:MAG: hypothetical protein IIB17_02905 [Chloroflexi bacterium]|nr:hypothetical protein [Chloroflexota bacterium]
MTDGNSQKLAPDESIPNLHELHERHPGLTEFLCKSFAEAAEVCLYRYHEPPINIDIEYRNQESTRTLNWSVPNGVAKNAWNNRDDATRDGAYAVSLAVLEAEDNLVTYGRADTKTGADWWIGLPGGSPDYEDKIRLEVSGTDAGSLSEIRQRLRRKIQQTLDGNSDTPAIAAVVGFKEKRVVLQYACSAPQILDTRLNEVR